MEEEAVLIEQATQNFDLFLNREVRNLVTYTQDSGLHYVSNPQLEKIKVDVKHKQVVIPLEQFLYNDWNEHEVMWHVYYELAHYSKWQSETELYAKRLNSWQKEMNQIVYLLSKKLRGNPNYTNQKLSYYVRNEMKDFLFILDQYLAYLTVLEKCPVYQDSEVMNSINTYLGKSGYEYAKTSLLPAQQEFIRSFMIYEINENYEGEYSFDEALIKQQLLGESLHVIVKRQFKKFIVMDASLDIKDDFIRNIIYPEYKKLWCYEIDHMMTQEEEGEMSEGEYELLDDKQESSEDSVESSQEDQEKIIDDMMQEEIKNQQMYQDSINKNEGFSDFGINAEEMELFHYYENAVSKQRQQMKSFWAKLVGNAKQEQSVKKTMQNKGKLNVNDLVFNYSQFYEAQQLHNYKNLPIFSRYELESSTKKLPQEIEIIFLVDNSGSMDAEKIDAARKAMAMTLLSLEDFDLYLKQNAQKLNQTLSIQTSTWLFGTDFKQIKDNDSHNKKQDRSELIQSITRIDGQYGTTDDGKCLREILNGLERSDINAMKSGRKIKMVFEITDGASSFPGTTKQALEGLLNQYVEVYAFQIGHNSDNDIKVFDTIFNDDVKNMRGVHVGEELERLPMLLMETVSKNLESIFNQ